MAKDLVVTGEKVPGKTFKNATARFILGNAEFEHDQLNAQLVSCALALEEAKSAVTRKDILDNQLSLTVSAYRELASTLARYTTFLCLSYKVEKLFLEDLKGMGVSEFPNHAEAFEYWVNEFLIRIEAPPPLRSKVKWIARENDDLELINRTNFEKAYIISKYINLLREYGKDVPEEILLMAEHKDTTAKDLTDILDWEYERTRMIEEYQDETGESPTKEELQEWEREYRDRRAKKSLGYRRGKKKRPLGDLQVHDQLVELPKGDGMAVARLQRTVFEDLLDGLDISDQGIFTFLHSDQVSVCALTQTEFTDADPKEVHHVLGKGAAGQVNWKFCNVIPILRSVHRTIEDEGYEAAYDKFGITELDIARACFEYTVKYVQFLENEVVNE